MTKKRELKSNEEVISGLRHIKEFNLSIDQIMYRYSVANIDKMCFEMGLNAVEGQNEKTKAFRLAKALSRCKIIAEFVELKENQEIDANVRALEQRRASGCNCG